MANDKPSVALPSSRRGLKGFFAETGRELRKVNWPTKQETTRLTGIVLSVCVMIAGILIVFQYVAGAAIDLLEKGRLS